MASSCLASCSSNSSWLIPPILTFSAGRGEAQDKLGRLERDLELRAVADAVEQHPVGMREPLAPVAGRRRWPGEHPVGRPPDDPHGAGDQLGLELSSRPAARARSSRAIRGAAATPSIWSAMSSAGMCSKLSRARSSRAAAPRGVEQERVCLGRRPAQQRDHLPLRRERRAVGPVALRPAAGGSERDHRARTPAGRQLQRHVAAERVACEVGDAEAGSSMANST